MIRACIAPSSLLASLITLGGPALAEPPRPAMQCNRPQVLELLHDALRRAGRPDVVERDSVGQIPAGSLDQVRCSARVRTREYDTNRMGYTPIERVGLVAYTLELRRNGMFLRLD